MDKGQIRRINFIGGACSGKSTVAPYIHSRLKKLGYKSSFATEYVKMWAYLDRHGEGYDQLTIFSNQLEREEIPLRCGEDISVSECPLFIIGCYAKRFESPITEEIFSMIDSFEEEYPSLNIFLNREGIEYVSEGRYGDVQTGIYMDNLMKDEMDARGISYTEFKTTEDEDRILEFILKRLESNEEVSP
jgi:hypothetical protein